MDTAKRWQALVAFRRLVGDKPLTDREIDLLNQPEVKQYILLRVTGTRTA